MNLVPSLSALSTSRAPITLKQSQPLFSQTLNTARFGQSDNETQSPKGLSFGGIIGGILLGLAILIIGGERFSTLQEKREATAELQQAERFKLLQKDSAPGNSRSCAGC